MIELLAFLSCIFGFLCLAIAMNRHHRQVLDRTPSIHKALKLRLLGSTVIAISFALCVIAAGWDTGTVLWFGVASASVLAITALLSYLPRWLQFFMP